MIAAHGYCSQEVVTLLLTGKAHSNVFDGTLEGVMDTPMMGIVDRCAVGYLTLVEALNEGYITVGDNYKRPRWPVYVICSESHYSVLFGLETALTVSDATEPFDLYYFDELARQDERIRYTHRPCATLGPLGLLGGLLEAFGGPLGPPGYRFCYIYIYLLLLLLFFL